MSIAEPCPQFDSPLPCLQAKVEVGILQMLNGDADREDGHHIVRMRDYFVHRQHLCLVFELLAINLYELIKANSFRGLRLQMVRMFVEQVCALAHQRCRLGFRSRCMYM